MELELLEVNLPKRKTKKWYEVAMDSWDKKYKNISTESSVELDPVNDMLDEHGDLRN